MRTPYNAKKNRRDKKKRDDLKDDGKMTDIIKKKR